MTEPATNPLTDFLSSPTVRRLLVTLSTGAVVALNSKLGLGLDPTEVGSLVALAVTYLVQSMAVDRARILAESKAAGDAAAAQVVSYEDAAKLLGLRSVAPAPEVKP